VISCGDIHQSFTDVLVKWFFNNFSMFANSFSVLSIHCVVRGLGASFLYKYPASRGSSLRQHGFRVIIVLFQSRVLFGRPFVKRFTLCYRTVVCPVCLPVCLSVTFVHCGQTVGTDQDETWHAGRPRPWPQCIRWRLDSHSPKGAHPSNFRPISVAAKWLHRSRCHLVWS